MAYTRENLLRRIIEIQELYKHHQARGATGTYIYDTYIRTRYHISRRTLSTYLSVNARRELRNTEIDVDELITETLKYLNLKS